MRESPPRLSALKPYLQHLHGLRGWYALSLVLGLLTLLSTTGLLALSGWFISAASVAGVNLVSAQAFNFFYPGAGVRGLALSRTAGRWAERVVTHEATFRLLAQVRVWLLGRLFPLSPRQIGVYHGADLLHRFLRDVEQLDGLLPRVILPALSLAAGLLLIAVALGWMLPGGAWPSVFVCAVLAAMAPVLWHIGRRGAQAYSERRAALRRAMVDTADGAAVLAFSTTAWQTSRDRALHASTQAMAAQWRHERLGALARAIIIATTGLMAWGAVMVWGDTVGTSNGPLLVAVVLLFLGLAEITAPLVTGLVELPVIAHAAARLDDITAQTPESPPPDSGPQPADGSVDIERICFAWDQQTPVLSDLSLRVAHGEHCFLSGDSGCGKSSLVQLVARFEAPQSGQIRLGGVALEALDEPTLRRTLAVASQFAWARQGTLADNLRIAAPDASPQDMHTALALAGLQDTVAAWPDGLNTWVAEGGHSLSGGQLRRLGVARALLRHAPITVLDEPTEGLDEAAALNMVERLTTALRGRTLIWISHRPQGHDLFDQCVTLKPAPCPAPL